MLGKVAKIMGVLALVAGVIAVFLAMLSRLDLSVLFGPKTYEVQYAPGIYTVDGYVSLMLDYQFTTPDNCVLGTVEERAVYSKISTTGLTLAEMEQKMQEQDLVIDLVALMPTGTNVIVGVQKEEYISKENFEHVLSKSGEVFNQMGYTVSNSYEVTELLERKCGKYSGSVYVDGVKANHESYVFVEDGYMWLIVFSYADGMEAGVEKLKAAFKVYE